MSKFRGDLIEHKFSLFLSIDEHRESVQLGAIFAAVHGCCCILAILLFTEFAAAGAILAQQTFIETAEMTILTPEWANAEFVLTC